MTESVRNNRRIAVCQYKQCYRTIPIPNSGQTGNLIDHLVSKRGLLQEKKIDRAFLLKDSALDGSHKKRISHLGI